MEIFQFINLSFFFHTDMLTELSRREKAANIKPDADIDMYMKVVIKKTSYISVT